MKSNIRTFPGQLHIDDYSYHEDGSSSVDEQLFFTVDAVKNLQVFEGGIGGTNRHGANPIRWRSTFDQLLTGSVILTRNSDGRVASNRYGAFSTYLMDTPLPDSDPNVYNECLSRVYDAVRGQIDLSVAIAEGHQTANMFRAASRTLEYVRKFRFKQLQQMYSEFLRYPPGSAKAVGSRWLEFQYGWRPLASDCWNACVELGRNFEPHMRIKKTSKQVSPLTLRDTGPTGESLFFDGTVSNRCLMDFRFTQPTELSNLISNFTSLNPLAIAWELTPYSFVADWFLDVGGYLRNYESALLLQSSLKDGYITETCRVEGKGGVRGQASNGPTTTYWNQTGSRCSSWKRRSVASGGIFPRLPRFRADLGSSRLLSAASLLSQHLRG